MLDMTESDETNRYLSELEKSFQKRILAGWKLVPDQND